MHIELFRRACGRFAFAMRGFNPLFNEVFSNKTQHLSGIVEYDPTNHERLTYDLALVDEAARKLRELMPDVPIMQHVAMKQARADFKIKQEADQQPIDALGPHLAPGIRLFPFQNAAVRFLMRAKSALLGDEMGLGKTLMSLSYGVAAAERLCIVCPKVVRAQWLAEAQKFFPDYFRMAVELDSNTIKRLEREQQQRPALLGARLVCVNYELLQRAMPLLIAGQFGLLVLDESHRVKNMKSKTYQTIEQLLPHVPRRLLLSGTAIATHKADLFTQLKIIAPDRFSDKHRSLGSVATGALWNQLHDIYLARRKRDVLPHMPKIVRQTIRFQVENPINVPPGIDAMSSARVDCSLSKLPMTFDFVQLLLDGAGGKLIVYAEYLDSVERIAHKFRHVAVAHHGSMTNLQRQRALDEFMSGRVSSPRMLVATRPSLATGINLQIAEMIVFHDLPWTATDVQQAEARAHRATTKHTVQVYMLVASNSSLDMRAAQLVTERASMNEMHLHGAKVSSDD